LKPDAQIKLVSQLLDLPLVDKDDRWCGVVDDVELEGSAGRQMRIKALLVGPGAYRGRLPAWLFAFVCRVAGDRVAKVPVARIEKIAAVVHLDCAAEKLGLHVTEDRVRPWIPHRGAL
jgi:hypothetical protein